MAEKVVMEMSLEQAGLLSRICDFYARMRNGQFSELGFELAMHKPKNAVDFDRDVFDYILMAARKMVFPELHGLGHHYGVGHDHTADEAWDMHEVIRHALAYHRDPEGGYTVDFREPMNWSGEPLIKCKIIDDVQTARKE